MPRPTPETLEAERARTAAAAALIDRDPEEARDRLAPAMANGVAEITPHDMFQLVLQMQARMNELSTQLVQVSQGGGSNNGRSRSDNEDELRQDAINKQALLDTWDTEPRMPVYLEPNDDERKLYAIHGKYPPRTFRVNGVAFPIQVGEVVNVPQSIHALVLYTQGRQVMTGPPQDLHQIPDPERSQFLAAGYAMTIGAAGTTGRGPILSPTQVSAPQPIDVRYDHNGQ